MRSRSWLPLGHGVDGPGAEASLTNAAHASWTGLLETVGMADLSSLSSHEAVHASVETGEGYRIRELCNFWLAAVGIYLVVLALAAFIYQSYLRSESGGIIDSMKRKRSRLISADATEITESKLELTCFTISFKDSTAEAEWREQAFSSQVPESVSVLKWVGMAITVYLTVHAILQTWRHDIHMWVPDILAIVLVFGATCAAWYWAKESPAWVYWCLLIFFFATLPAVQLPPFAASCGDFEKMRNDYLIKKKDNFDFGIEDTSIRHSDCTLEGHSSMLMLMTWIVLQPWVLPHYGYMHMLWLWIFFVLGGWDMAYSAIGHGNQITFCMDNVVMDLFVESECEEEYEVFDRGECLKRGLILAITLVFATHKKYTLEKSRRLKFLQVRQHRASSFRIYEILNFMMPQHVVFKLMRDEPIAESLEKVSILFVVIADFDVLTQDKTPSELLNFLNHHFEIMDDLCRQNKVTKIETVCEEYVAAVGVLPDDVEDNKQHGHTPLLGRLFNCAEEILLQQSQDQVTFKMGIHTGPCFAGVIGTKLPRYRLFGDTMNTSARMMQKGLLGHLQFGQETYNHLSKERKAQVSRPREVEMKGKGIVKAYTFKPPDGAVATKKSARGTRFRTTRKGNIVQHLKGPQQDEHEVQEILAQEANPDVERSFVEREEEATAKKFTWDTWLKWFAWFNETTVSHKITRRLGFQAIIILVISGVELIWSVAQHRAEIAHMAGNDFVDDNLSVAHYTVFMICRGTILLILLALWYFADYTVPDKGKDPSRKSWMEEHPGAVQVILLSTSMVSIVAIYISYEALFASKKKDFYARMIITNNLHEVLPDQLFPLNQVLLMLVFMRQYGLLAGPTLFFVPLVGSLIAFPDSALHFLHFMPHLQEVFFFSLDKTQAATLSTMYTLTGGFCFLVLALVQVFLAWETEQQSRLRFKLKEHFERDKQITADMLEKLMPPLVAKQVAGPESNIISMCHEYRHCTITQSDLCGFTQLVQGDPARGRKGFTPLQVVGFMEELFDAFDKLAHERHIYKVETVGDAYIAGMAEAPLTTQNSPWDVLLFGFDMVQEVDDWARRGDRNFNVRCRVGIHTGECIGGIVGADMQRYHLFGKLIRELDILESTSETGRVHVSQACKLEVERQLREDSSDCQQHGCSLTQLKSLMESLFVKRKGDCLKTSKGEVHSFEEVGGQTYLMDGISAEQLQAMIGQLREQKRRQHGQLSIVGMVSEN